IALQEDAMALGGLDVEPDVVEVGRVEPEHGDVAEDDFAVARSRSRGGESAAMFAFRLDGGLGLWRWEPDSFKADGRVRQGGIEGIDLRPRIESDDVQ